MAERSATLGFGCGGRWVAHSGGRAFAMADASPTGTAELQARDAELKALRLCPQSTTADQPTILTSARGGSGKRAAVAVAGWLYLLSRPSHSKLRMPKASREMKPARRLLVGSILPRLGARASGRRPRWGRLAKGAPASSPEGHSYTPSPQTSGGIVVSRGFSSPRSSGACFGSRCRERQVPAVHDGRDLRIATSDLTMRCAPPPSAACSSRCFHFHQSSQPQEETCTS